MIKTLNNNQLKKKEISLFKQSSSMKTLQITLDIIVKD